MSTYGVSRPLDAAARLDGFSCGVESMDLWLTGRALANQEMGASRVYVICDDQGTVVAYYSLSAGSVLRMTVPRGRRHGAPDPVPILLIGRFAVDSRHHGLGLGASMLQDALVRCARLHREVAFMFVAVHPLDESAASFWRHHGFTETATKPSSVMLLDARHLTNL